MSTIETFDRPDTGRGYIRTVWVTNVTSNCDTNWPMFPCPVESVVRVWGRWVAKSVAEAIRAAAQEASELTPRLVQPPYQFKAKSLLSFRMVFRWSARRWRSNT